MNLMELATRTGAAGSNWFKPETMRWWHCRISEVSITLHELEEGTEVWRFISSEPESGYLQRVYTVREARFTRQDDGSETVEFRNVGGLGAYKHLSTAKHHLRDRRER